MTEKFGADWLRLREAFDHAARSGAMVQGLIAQLPPKRPTLVDLGGGTGNLFRFLAPLIGRGQDWLLIDADRVLLDEAFGITAAWARRRGYAATSTGDTLEIATPRGVWRLRPKQRDLAQTADLPLDDVDAVLCSALLDLVSERWLESVIAVLRVPFLASLTVDGRDEFLPRHPADAILRTAFRRDQQRDKGLGRALGVNASQTALRAFSAHGFSTYSAPADWRIPPAALAMQHALIDGHAAAARRAMPVRAAAVAAWERARLTQAMRGRLAIRVGHRDILALPPGG